MSIYILIFIIIVVGVGCLVYFIIQADKKGSEHLPLKALATDPSIIAESNTNKQKDKIKGDQINGMKKKWPILAQILIGLGCIGSLAGIIRGLIGHDIINLVLAVVTLVIFWSLYKFKSWALKGILILITVNTLVIILGMFGQSLPVIGLYMISVIYNGGVFWYFNSSQIKGLFQNKLEQEARI